MIVHDDVEQTFRVSNLEKNYNAVLAENEQLLNKQQTLSCELLEMKNAFAQLKKEQTSAKNSQTPVVDNKEAKGDLLYSKLREESAKERARAHELTGELQKSETKLIETSTLLAKAENTTKMHKVQIQDIEKEFRLSCDDGVMLRDQLNHSRWEAKSALNNNIIEKNKLMLQITNLTFQRDTSDNKSKELSSKLTTLQQSYYEATDAQKDLKDECDKYSSQLMAAKRNYKDLSGLYDEQNNHVNDQAQQYQASIRKLEEKIYQLSAENKKLNAEKAIQASTTQNKDEEQQYDDSKTLFRRPDRIIDHYSMLLDQSHEKNDTIQGLKASNAHIQKSLDRLQTEFTIKSTSYESLIESHEKLQQDYKDQTAQLKQSEKETITLKDTLHSQKRDHDELSNTLKDREYQLQYVLKNTPYKAMAPNSRPNLVTQLLSVTLQPASNPSSVEFKNIQEMQALNSRLITENNSLKTKIKRISNTTSQTTVPLEIASSSELPVAQTDSTEKTSNEAVKTGLSDTSSQVVIDEYKVKVGKLTKDVKELQCELAFSQEEASTAKQETNKKSVTISQLENKCEVLEQKAALLEQNLNLTTAERSRLKGVVDAAKEQENGVKKQLSALDSQSSRQLEEIGTLKQRLSQVQASYHRALEDLRSARNEVPELEAFIKRNTLLVKQKEKVDNKTIQDLREELQRAKTELSSAKKDLQIFLSRTDNLKASANDGSQTKYMETLDNIVKLRVVTEKLDSQDKIIKELVTEKKSLMEKLDEAEETIKTNHLSRGQSTSSSTTTSVQSRLLADSQKRVVELEEKLTYYQQEIDRLKKEAQDAYKLNQENLQNNRDYVAKSIKSIDNQNEILKATQIKSQHSIDSFEITITASNGEIDKLKQENGTLSSQLLELKTENANLGSKLDNSKEEINMQAEKVVDLEENARIQEELLDDRQKEVQELQRVLQGLQTDLANAKGYEASAKEYAEEYKGTLQTSIERWNSTMDTLTAQYNTYGIESTKWSQKLQQVVQENFDKITQEVPPADSQDAAAMIESLQRLNNALAGEKRDMEAMLESKLGLLETAQKELIAEKSELSSLVDKVAFLRDSNQALLTKAKPNDDLYQTELHAYSVQNEKLRSDKERLSAKLADVTNQLNIKIPEVQALEGQVLRLTSELETANTEVRRFIETEQSWAGRSANLLEVTGHLDPKEMDELKSECENAKAALASSKSELEALTAEHTSSKSELEMMKADLESSKAELEAARKELETVQSNVTQLESAKGVLETERRELIKKANDRARFALEFKKRSTDAEKKVEEKDKLIAEKEKQLADERTKIAELKKKLEEEGKGTKPTETDPTTQTSENNDKEVSNDGVSKVNQDALKKAEEARAEAVSKLEASEKEASTLKNRQHNMLLRMKALQNEKVKYEKELEALKAAKPLKTSSEDAERIKTLEAQIAELKKTVSDSTIENNRLKASNSMNTNRSKKLMDEINKMKTLLDKTIADKAKLAAKAPEATKAGDKRTREDGELDDDVSPSKKPVA